MTEHLAEQAEEDLGYKIQGRFFPFIGLDDWTQAEDRAVRRVAGCPIRDILLGNADNRTIHFAFATAAFFHANPTASENEIVAIMSNLTAKDVVPVGFEPVADQDGQSPPAADDGNGSSASTEPSSESTPESSSQPDSGTPSSPGSSTSGRPKQPERSATAT